MKEKKKTILKRFRTCTFIFLFDTQISTNLSGDSASLVVCYFSEKLLGLYFLLLILPALFLQLLELQVLETFCLGLKHLTVLTQTHT